MTTVFLNDDPDSASTAAESDRGGAQRGGARDIHITFMGACASGPERVFEYKTIIVGQRPICAYKERARRNPKKNHSAFSSATDTGVDLNMFTRVKGEIGKIEIRREGGEGGRKFRNVTDIIRFLGRPLFYFCIDQISKRGLETPRAETLPQLDSVA